MYYTVCIYSVELGAVDMKQEIEAILQSSTVMTGFPSPAESYQLDRLNLNDFLIKHPSATYLAYAAGNSMEAIGIYSSDLLVVDRSLEPRHGDIVVAAVDGEFTAKYLDLKLNQLVAFSINNEYPPIPIDETVTIEGVISNSIRRFRV